MKKTLKSYLFALTGMLFSTITYAQVTFTFKDAKDKSTLPAVSFNISKDTTKKQTLLSDAQGKINIPNLASGKYRIQTSYIGYVPIDTTMNIETGQSIALFLEEDAVQLKGVTVEAKRKFIEMKKGNFIMDPNQNAITSTGNIWDALKYGPLVETRPDGTLNVQNKPATVFIDGRQVLMTGEELKQYLENIPAANTTTVEISSHPGAKYDSNVGAVILIKTTNLQYEGIKGILTATGTQGVYPRGAAGLLLNARKGAFTSQVGYNYNQTKIKNISDINTIGTSQGLPWAVNQTGISENKSNRVYANLNYDFNKNNLLSLYTEYTPHNGNSTVTGNNGAFTQQRATLKDSIWNSFNTVKSNSNTLSSQAIFETKWDSTKQSMKFIALYSKNNGNATINNDLSYFDEGGILKQKTPFYQALTPRTTSFLNLSVNYVRPLFKGEWISGLGYSNTLLQNINTGYIFNNIERTQGQQTVNTVILKYRESNYSAFTSWEVQIKDWYYQLGMRLENNQVFSQKDGGVDYKVYDRITLFPKIYIQRKINDKNLISLTYDQQLTRPDYSLLNPFNRFTDNTVVSFLGNSEIKPARTYALYMDWTFNNKLVISLGNVYIKDYITTILIRKENQLISQYDNISLMQPQLSAYYSLQPAKFWYLSFNGIMSTFLVQQYKDLAMGKSNVYFSGTINNNFQLPQGWRVGLSFTAGSNQSDRYSMHRRKENLSAAIVKEFKKPNLILSLSGTDLLKTNYTGDRFFYLPYNSLSYGDARTVSFGLTYRFGKQTVKTKEVKEDENLQKANDRLR